MARLPDGNIAFKVTWVYGSQGPFTSPCTPAGRHINIVSDPRVWCSQQSCACWKIYHRNGNSGDYWTYHNRADLDQWPCYDTLVFVRWQFGSGIYHHGPNKGNAIPIKHCRPGKLAFFTSKQTDEPEAERRIIGCFSIAGMTQDPDWGHVIHAGNIRLRASNLSHAPLYWKLHRQAKGPRWNTGLFRYVSDQEAHAMLNALLLVS